MKIIEKKIDEIYAYENNPRINDNAVEKVAASIENFGFKVPIVIDRNGVIIAGHTRKRAAEKLGLTSVPCIIADDLDEEQVKAFRLADNKTGEFAEWDLEKLEQELESLNMDMEIFGFENDLIEWADVEDISDDTYEEPKKTAIKCPCCGYTDVAKNFIKTDITDIEKVNVEGYEIRPATLEDIDGIKRIADANSNEIGFVLRPALEEAVGKNHLIVACNGNEVLGFCNYNIRKDDGATVIYEICTDYKYRGNHIGARMIDALNRPVRLKCPEGNESNKFYEHYGFELKEVEAGKKRRLNVWELR